LHRLEIRYFGKKENKKRRRQKENGQAAYEACCQEKSFLCKCGG
jgi:hypothetical protein